MNVRQVVALLGWIAVLAAGWMLFIGRVEPSALSFSILVMFVAIAIVASAASTMDFKTT